MPFEIEKDVEIPETREKGRFPLQDMQVGDSFFLAADEKDINSLRMAVQYYQRKTSSRFTIRTVEGGSRCWRVEAKAKHALPS